MFFIIIIIIFVVLIVVICGAETGFLTVTEENILRMSERKIIRKIYGPVMENNIWRISHNEEINAFLKGEDIKRFIKSQRWKTIQYQRKC
jgi:hypothetical protein